MKKRFILHLLLVPIIALVPVAVQAHKMDSAMTIIDVAKNGQDVEITHRIFAHDIEHVFDLQGARLNFFETREGQELISEYVSRAFFLGSRTSEISQRFIGVELAGDLIYVYFEANIGDARELVIDSNILEEFSGSQTNYVNIHIGGNTKSLIFRNGEDAQVLQLR